MKKQKYFLYAALVILALTGCTRPKTDPDAQNKAAADNYPQILASTIEAVKKSPSFDNFISIGLLYSTHGDHNNALLYFQKADQASPNSPIALNDVCAELNSLSHWTEAVPYCERAVKAEPTFTLAQNNLAYAKNTIASLQKGIADLTKAMNATNRDANLLDIGMRYNQLGDYQAAIKQWSRIPTKSHWYATAQNNIGSNYIILKDYANAEKSLKVALKLDPDNQLIKNNMQWLEDARKNK